MPVAKALKVDFFLHRLRCYCNLVSKNSRNQFSDQEQVCICIKEYDINNLKIIIYSIQSVNDSKVEIMKERDGFSKKTPIFFIIPNISNFLVNLVNIINLVIPVNLRNCKLSRSTNFPNFCNFSRCSQSSWLIQFSWLCKSSWLSQCRNLQIEQI